MTRNGGVFMTLDSIMDAIKEANGIVIFTHENPDGDAIGSSMAMYLVLKEMGKEVDLVIPSYPKTFKFLPGCENVILEPKLERYDLAIALDCADIKRLDDPKDTFMKCETRVNIDHHTSNGMFGDLNFVDPVAPACSQIVTTILSYFKVDISRDVATCLITGIITDTGGFRYEGVTTETFEIASGFLSKGVNISKIYKDSLSNISREKFEARKLAANRTEFLENGKIAYTYMTKEDMEKLNVARSDLDGIVEHGRDVEGVEVSIFLYETDKGFKASLRSNNYVNVSDVCLLFNGGGHIRAAGCTISYPLEEAKKRIINEVKRFLK